MGYGKVVTVHEDGSGTYSSPIFRDRFRLLNVHIRWIASATVGNRAIKMEVVLPDGHVLWDTRSDANQGASTTRHYSMSNGFPRETSFSGNNDLYLPLPLELVLAGGMQMVISDATGVDANDTWRISYQYEEI